MLSNVLVKDGTVIDGTGRPKFLADILVGGGRIEHVGPLSVPEDAVVLDASGCVVAPGFIDVHSHSDFTLLVDPRAVSSVAQGVTLEVIGNCGWGCSPIGDPGLAKDVIYGYRPQPPITWRDTAGYLDRLERARPAVNVVTLVPNGQLRLATVGVESRPARPDELDRMKVLLRQGIEQGAWGLSTGLEYATEVGASEAEVAELCREVARSGGFYATHTRNRDENAVEAVAEAIRTAERTGVRLQISHITPRGGRSDTEKAISLVEAARARGSDVAFDMHTRTYGTTYLKVLLPFWAFEGGTDALRQRLQDPEARVRMTAFQNNPIAALKDWSRVVLLDNPAVPQFSRRDLADIGREMGKPPFDCALDILLAEVDQIHRPMVILHSYTEDLLRDTYRHPVCTVGSDATALAPDGPLAGSVFHGAYTWASWFYRRMVRETRTFTPEEGIRKLTGLAAERLGLSDRGVIRPGARADLAIFDPATFGETGTTFEPSRLAQGMRHVLVNGVMTWRDGVLTGNRGGQVLRRTS